MRCSLRMWTRWGCHEQIPLLVPGPQGEESPLWAPREEVRALRPLPGFFLLILFIFHSSARAARGGPFLLCPPQF